MDSPARNGPRIISTAQELEESEHPLHPHHPHPPPNISGRVKNEGGGGDPDCISPLIHKGWHGCARDKKQNSCEFGGDSALTPPPPHAHHHPHPHLHPLPPPKLIGAYFAFPPNRYGSVRTKGQLHNGRGCCHRAGNRLLSCLARESPLSGFMIFVTGKDLFILPFSFSFSTTHPPPSTSLHKGWAL